MIRKTACCLSLLAVCVAGCTVPVGSQPRHASKPASRPPVPRTEAANSDAEAGPVSELRVNGESISAEELWSGSRQKLAERAEMLDQAAYAEFVSNLAAQLIADRIAEMLLYQQATLRLPDNADERIGTYIDAEIRKIVSAEHGGVQRRYERYLAEQGSSIEDVRTKLRRELTIASYLDREIKPKVADPTRAELVSVFEANHDQWRRPASRSMSLIDVRTERFLPEGTDSPTPDQLAAARQEALSAIKSVELELRNGADFATLAREHSDGLHAREGGSWGEVAQGSVRARFEPAVDALFRLREGEISQVVETSDGFFLVRCDEAREAVEPQFQDVQPELKQRHFQLAYNTLVAELIQDLRNRARIQPANLERFHEAAVQVAMQANEGPRP